MEDLHAGEVEMAIVGGVDTLLEEDTLEWLQITGRLSRQVPLQVFSRVKPGHFCLLETMQNAKAKGTRAFVSISDVRLAEEPRTLLSTDPPMGHGILEILTGIGQSAGWDDSQFG